MATGSTHTLTAPNMKENGRTSNKHGKGIQISASKIVTIGTFIEGLIQGYGQRIWPDSSVYKGDFTDGQMSGSGKWRKGAHETANSYEGEFKNDMKHGKGTFKWGKSGN